MLCFVCFFRFLRICFPFPPFPFSLLLCVLVCVFGCLLCEACFWRLSDVWLCGEVRSHTQPLQLTPDAVCAMERCQAGAEYLLELGVRNADAFKDKPNDAIKLAVSMLPTDEVGNDVGKGMLMAVCMRTHTVHRIQHFNVHVGAGKHTTHWWILSVTVFCFLAEVASAWACGHPGSACRRLHRCRLTRRHHQETRRAAAVWFRAVRGTPWSLTDGYQSCVKEGKHSMQMTGEGDPLGGGRGYSFLAVEKKVWRVV